MELVSYVLCMYVACVHVVCTSACVQCECVCAPCNNTKSANLLRHRYFENWTFERYSKLLCFLTT